MKEHSSFKLNSVFSNIDTNERYGFFHGVVTTPSGMVKVYSQDAGRPYTVLQTFHNNRLYSRRVRKSFTKRGLAIIAHRFVKEVVAGKHG